MSNNPFALPTQESLAAARFPAVEVPSSSSPYPQQQYGQQQQYVQQQYSGQQQQPMYAQQTGYAGQSSGFQPTSSFGQNLQAYGSQFNFGVPQSAQYSGSMSHNAGSSAYYAQPQPQAYQNQLVADLDPFSAQYRQQQASASVATYSQPAQQSNMYNTTTQQQETRQQEQYGEHPRAFMRQNASSLEQWDKAAWARVRALLNQLEKAWEGRKKLVAEWQTWNMSVDDRDTVDKLRKEVDVNIDTVAAFTLQVKEIFDSYRHSSDNYSRNQVKQAMNAGLQSLPDWPLTLEPPPRLAENEPSRTSLFDSGPPQQQQQQPQWSQQNQQQQQQQQPQQQQAMYAQQTGYGQQQQQYGYGQQMQMQPTGMQGYGQQGMGMYRQW